MNRVASQTEIGKICSEQSPCSASRLSRPADTLSGALSHGQDRELAHVPRAFPSLQPNDPIVKELRAENVRLADERTKAYLELMELLELEMMPREEMGSA